MMSKKSIGGLCGLLAPHALFLLLLLLCEPISVLGQTPTWSLEACIQYAWNNNPEIQLQKIELQQTRLQHQERLAAFTPSIIASGNQPIQTKSSIQAAAHWELRAELTLFQGGSRINRLRSSREALLAEKHETECLREDLRLEITRQYLDVLLAIELSQLAEESKKTLLTQQVHTRNLVEAGSLPYASLLELEAQVAQEIYQATEAANQCREALLTLRQSLNLPSHIPLYPDTTLLTMPVPLPITLCADTLFSQTQDYPTLQAAHHRMEQTRWEWLSTQGLIFPNISLVAYYQPNYPQPFSFGLQLQWPLWHQGNTVRSIKRSELEYQRSQLQLLQTQQAHYKNLQLLIHEATCAYQQYLAACHHFQAQENSFKQVVQKFNLGLIDGNDYARAHQQRINARSEMLQSHFSYYFQCKILDYYQESTSTGESLSF